MVFVKADAANVIQSTSRLRRDSYAPLRITSEKLRIFPDRTLRDYARVSEVLLRSQRAAVLKAFARLRIILTNAVKYVTNFESYDRRIQSAINIQGVQDAAPGEILLARAVKKSGC